MEIALVAAHARNRVIGRDGDMPWHIPGELRRFRALTWGCPLIIGHTTYRSIDRPLPGRTTIVLSRRDLVLPEGIHHARTADEALRHARAIGGPRICIGGGGEIYRLYLPVADRLYLSEIDATVDGDVRFPEFSEHHWTPIASETVPGTPGYTARVYARRA